jgi:DNA-binding MarR family transcriptional regulator
LSKHLGHAELVSAVMEAVVAFQDATEGVDEAAANRLGLNRTDLRCLDLLSRSGPMTSGGLAGAAGLSPAAATTAIDRLTRAGYVRRRHDDEDRRRVLVEPTAEAVSRAEQIYRPIGEESQRILSRRTTAELRTILDFLEEGRELQRRHSERIAE